MWVFAAGDHPGRGRPSGQVDQSGDLGDLGSFSFVAAVGGDSWPPAAIGQSGNDRGELGGEAMPDDEPDLALAAGIQEAVGQPAESVRAITFEAGTGSWARAASSTVT